MSRVALFTYSQDTETPPHPLTVEWMKKRWYIDAVLLSHTEGYIMPFAATQRHLAMISLSEDRRD